MTEREESKRVPWTPSEMADLLDALARSADYHTNSYSETAHLARWGAVTIRHLIARADGELSDAKEG